jgi:hypothetical protein
VLQRLRQPAIKSPVRRLGDRRLNILILHVSNITGSPRSVK